MADKKVKELNDNDLEEVTGGLGFAKHLRTFAANYFSNSKHQANSTNQFTNSGNATLTSSNANFANKQGNSANKNTGNVSSLSGYSSDNEDDFVR